MDRRVVVVAIHRERIGVVIGVLAVVPDAVAVRIELAGIVKRRTVVTGAPDGVVVRIRLGRVRHQRAVVVEVDDPVRVGVLPLGGAGRNRLDRGVGVQYPVAAEIYASHQVEVRGIDRRRNADDRGSRETRDLTDEAGLVVGEGADDRSEVDVVHVRLWNSWPGENLGAGHRDRRRDFSWKGPGAVDQRRAVHGVRDSVTVGVGKMEFKGADVGDERTVLIAVRGTWEIVQIAGRRAGVRPGVDEGGAGGQPQILGDVGAAPPVGQDSLVLGRGGYAGPGRDAVRVGGARSVGDVAAGLVGDRRGEGEGF